MKALSLRQPWADAVLFGGKRIENRVAWRTSNFRGEFLIHAAKGCAKAEYAGAVSFLEERRIGWRPKPQAELVRGAIVGRARVVGIVDERAAIIRRLTDSERAWWMGAFGLVLDDVVAFERPIPWVGMLGFFNVPFDRDGNATGEVER